MVEPGPDAPFRAFVQDRKSRAAEGRNCFLRDQKHATDYLYGDEWTDSREKTRGPARSRWSRDQLRKSTFQDRMAAKTPRALAWLQGGALFLRLRRYEAHAKTSCHLTRSSPSRSDDPGRDGVREAAQKEKRYQASVLIFCLSF